MQSSNEDLETKSTIRPERRTRGRGVKNTVGIGHSSKQTASFWSPHPRLVPGMTVACSQSRNMLVFCGIPVLNAESLEVQRTGMPEFVRVE